MAGVVDTYRQPPQPVHSVSPSDSRTNSPSPPKDRTGFRGDLTQDADGFSPPRENAGETMLTAAAVQPRRKTRRDADICTVAPFNMVNSGQYGELRVKRITARTRRPVIRAAR